MSEHRAVLIVDDDPFIRKLIRTTLEGVSAFDLHEESDGEESVQAARREGPRLVFPTSTCREWTASRRAGSAHRAGDDRREDRDADRLG